MGAVEGAHRDLEREEAPAEIEGREVARQHDHAAAPRQRGLQMFQSLDVPEPAADYWLGTGDLFQELPGGHLQIVDRIKDMVTIRLPP